MEFAKIIRVIFPPHFLPSQPQKMTTLFDTRAAFKNFGF